MRILCLDVGSGTQDILLLDTAQPVENSIQMVLPSPTVLVAQEIGAATERGDAIVLTGELMGGGACTGALKKHLEMGLEAYATPNAALSFNDDLEKVASWGVRLLSPDEAARFKKGTAITMRDVTLDVLEKALSSWGISFVPDIIGVAVQDHGAAPPDESQRLFRFRQLEGLLKQNNALENLVFASGEIPDCFTRMQAVTRSVASDIPLVLMDTGAAAVLGTSVDKVVAAHSHRLAVNLGNSHTLAFFLDESRVLGLFEHHTSALSLSRLEELLEKLVAGDLTLEEVWNEGGHGSLIMDTGKNPFLVATGPRRALLETSRLNPYFAAPCGSMMLVGCFGLALGVAIKFPDRRSEIEKALLLG